MHLDLEQILHMFAQSYCTQLTVVEPPFTQLETFDQGIRKMLMPDFDFSAFGQAILEKVPKNTFILTCDEFGCCYGLFRLPDSENRVYILGAAVRPHIKAETQNQILQQFGSEKFKDFMQIYQSIPVEYGSGCREFVNALYASAFPEETLTEVEMLDFFPMPLLHTAAPGKPLRNAEAVDYLLVKDLVNLEMQLMSYVEAGDADCALDILSQLPKFSLPETLSDPSQNIRRQAHELNDVCKFVINSTQKVHPGYAMDIHKIFNFKIQAAVNQRELLLLANQMVLSYCECLKKHSLDSYSPLIRRALNCIHLSTDSSLSLRSLALLCNVNPSYLSKQFRSETGATVTEYINNYRVEQSIPFLRFTNLGIAQISEKVGFLDENYYARIFKRLKGMSPKAYRQMNQL